MTAVDQVKRLRILLKRDATAVEFCMRAYRILIGDRPKTDKMLVLEEEYRALLSPAVNIIGLVGESKICAIFDYLVHNDDCLVIGRLHPGIQLIKREVRSSSGLADRVLHHADGVITVVEVKAAGSRRDHAQGLGQVLMYAATLREETNAPDVQCALFVGGDYDVWVAHACQSVGVTYINLPSHIEQVIDEYSLLAKQMAEA
jgi:hypothetical protein